MKKIINGKEYKFVVSFFKCKNVFCFEIRAINLHTKRYSFINNLNCILSELDVDIDDNEKMEFQWGVKEKEGRQFFKKSVNFISDKIFKQYLEKQLDLDRWYGEWENKIKLNNHFLK